MNRYVILKKRSASDSLFRLIATSSPFISSNSSSYDLSHFTPSRRYSTLFSLFRITFPFDIYSGTWSGTEKNCSPSSFF